MEGPLILFLISISGSIRGFRDDDDDDKAEDAATVSVWKALHIDYLTVIQETQIANGEKGEGEGWGC